MAKWLILLEISGLWVGTLLIVHSKRGVDWPTVFVENGPRSAFASALLLAILLGIADLGADKEAAALSTLIVGSFLIEFAAGVSLGLDKAITEVLK